MATVITMSVILCVLLLLITTGGATSSNSYSPASGPPSIGTFDFIIVGAGASGSIVAARLAENETVSILLLEGGAEGTGQRDVGGTDYVASYFKRDPVTGKQTLDKPLTRYDVPTMADTIRLASDVLDNVWPINASGPFYTQAKVIGGNQATNGLAWTPILKQKDLDEWNIPGYSAAQFWPYLKKVENATATGYHFHYIYGGSPNRGNAGPINVQYTSFVQKDQQKFIQACNSAGYPTGGDINAGTIPVGIYQCPINVKAGIRQSSSLAYLAPLLKNCPPKFKFRPDSVVTRVTFNSAKSATGVEFMTKTGLKTAQARKEVILAAGDLQVAKLLMNSGIGPLSTLTAFNKPKIVVNELVGQKIRNHQRVAMRFNDSTLVNANFYVTPPASVQYARDGTGIVEGRASFFLFFNSTNCTSRCPDLQATAGAAAGAAGSIDYYSQAFTVLIGVNYNLYANGSLNLTSSDPLAASKFTANILLLDGDVRPLADGILQVRELITNHWDGVVTEISPGPAVNTTEALIPWIRANAATTCHYYGSAPMGTNKSNSVTDSRMRVHGVQRLRVVGPSVIPAPIFPSMQHMANGLGEKGAALIIEDYGL